MGGINRGVWVPACVQTSNRNGNQIHLYEGLNTAGVGLLGDLDEANGRRLDPPALCNAGLQHWLSLKGSTCRVC